MPLPSSTACTRRWAPSPTRSGSPTGPSARGSRATRRRSSPGSTLPRARSARGLRSLSGLPSPASTSTGFRSTFGCSVATAIFDVNRLGQRGPTEYEWNLDVYRRRAEAFGCRAIVIDGHDLGEIDEALGSARSGGDRPTVVIARTIKGKGFKEIENKDGWHGKALPPDMADRAIAELGGERNLLIDVQPPEPLESASSTAVDTPVQLPTYEMGDKVATRKAYGDALRALGAR